MLSLCDDKSINMNHNGIILSDEQINTCIRYATIGATIIDEKKRVELLSKYTGEMLAELRDRYNCQQDAEEMKECLKMKRRIDKLKNKGQ